ncbi:hypothetical protein [Carboxylicivirga marina]|uniref:Uncharacterized protein n=1 Tax=Carboxylicivirga marina TaxID=2800988 RepID=A0ABS1HNN0_9BACT|nr:hypothetical protein [Carboxylicivirga marina]MBK3518863.1 hypothetical protein [Carboxylicivirga marina]
MTLIDILIGILAVAGVYGVFFLLYVLYAKLSRSFKKKSYHHMVQPEPDKDSNWKPINFSYYRTYIFIKDTDEEYIIRKIKRFLGQDGTDASFEELDNYIDSGLSVDEYIKVNKRDNNDVVDLNTLYEKISEDWDKIFAGENSLQIEVLSILKRESWHILEVKNSTFSDFISLVWWLDDESMKYKQPSAVIAFCQNQRIAMEDFICKIDNDTTNDDFIGSFRNNKNFGIHYPHVHLSKSGNISLSKVREIWFDAELAKIPFDLVNEEKTPFEIFYKRFSLQAHSST